VRGGAQHQEFTVVRGGAQHHEFPVGRQLEEPAAEVRRGLAGMEGSTKDQDQEAAGAAPRQ
jgi:hypothetical protein